MPRSPSTVRRLLHSKLCRTGSPVACRKWTVLDVLQFIHAPGAAAGFRVHVGVLHIRLLMSLTHLSASELAVDLGLCLVARLNLGKAGCWWAHRAKSRWSPPCFPCLGGLGASEEPHGPVDHLSETTGSTLHKVGALVENHS